QPAQVIPVRLSDLLRDGDMSQDIAMQPGDTLVIPQGWF
ncbi:sugar ABC transporter substrate-binding protein, partial [Roseomonas ludipueritiae]|nr:sugar ABC transporter substrate-binding protein [Pseudoroseomonas ludipueritiae]